MKNQNPSVPETLRQADEKDEPFLQRWSHRKLKASQADVAQESEDVASGQRESLSEPVDLEQSTKIQAKHPEEQEKELTDQDMPPLDSLDESSDFSGFFSSKVSEALRRQALRKLFHFPAFNVTDGLNDYDEDFTQFETLGNILTHEMKRMLERETELARKSDEASKQPAADENPQHSELEYTTQTEANDKKHISAAELIAETEIKENITGSENPDAQDPGFKNRDSKNPDSKNPDSKNPDSKNQSNPLKDRIEG